MKRISVCTAYILLAAIVWLAAPVTAVDLPNPVTEASRFIMNVGNGSDLEGNVGPANTGVQVRDFSSDFANTPQWAFVPTGQPGRVVIVTTDVTRKALVFLEAETAANLTGPVGVKVSPFTAVASVRPSGQWRIIESPVNGPFNIMNVQTGRLLEADSTDPLGQKVQLQGRDGSNPNRQWRFFPSKPLWTTPKLKDPVAASPAGRKSLSLPDLGLPGQMSVEPTGEDFTGQVVEVSVEVTIIGNSTNKLAAEVKMTVKGDRGKPPIVDKKVYPILEAAAGRQIFLNPSAGPNPSQNFTYKAGPGQVLDKTWKLISAFPNSVSKADPVMDPPVTLIGSPKIESLVPGMIPAELNTPAAALVPPDPNMPFRLISFCLCVGDPSGNPASLLQTPTGVAVFLESIPYFVDGPAAKP